MIQEIGFNVGKPTGSCGECGSTFVRYCDVGDINTYQACPHCEDV
jgi:hypothetical protein